MTGFYNEDGVLTDRGLAADKDLRKFIKRWTKKHAQGCTGNEARQLELLYHHGIGAPVALYVAALRCRGDDL